MTRQAKPQGNGKSLPREYFDSLYAKDLDPWHFATSAYEHSKYAATLEILNDQPLGSVFEVGCSIGILTGMLAARCGYVLAVDVSETALASARNNCSAAANVSICRMEIPAEWPTASFDLILFSEVLYFLGPADIRIAARKTMRSLSSAGGVLLVNWLGATDSPCNGDEACAIFISETSPRLEVIAQRRNPHYRLDLLGVTAPTGDAA